MKAFSLLIAAALVLTVVGFGAAAQTDDDGVVRTKPYDPDSVPLSVQKQRDEAKLREKARKKVDEVLGPPEPAPRHPDEGDSTSTSQ
jgi:hypothetical protein